MYRSTEFQSEKNYLIYIVAVVIGIMAVIATLTSMISIPTGHVGVVLEFGKIKGTIGEGLSFVAPVISSVVAVNVQTQKYETDAGAASKDLQIVNSKIAVNFKIKQDSVESLYREVGIDYPNKLIQPAVQEVVKANTAKFTAEELITKRETVKANIENDLRSRLSRFGIQVDGLSITNFDFSPEFNRAIEQKVTAEQEALRAKNDLERIKIEAQQQIETAKAEAETTKLNAQASAESLRLQYEQLQKSSSLLSLRWIEKWDGNLPQTVVVSDEQSFLLNLPTTTAVEIQNITQK